MLKHLTQADERGCRTEDSADARIPRNASQLLLSPPSLVMQSVSLSLSLFRCLFSLILSLALSLALSYSHATRTIARRKALPSHLVPCFLGAINSGKGPLCLPLLPSCYPLPSLFLLSLSVLDCVFFSVKFVSLFPFISLFWSRV